MQLESKYAVSAWEDIQSGIDHFVLGDDAGHRRKAVLDLSGAVESLLREKLRLLGHPHYEDLQQFSQILEHLQDRGVSVPLEVLWKLRHMRNEAMHRSHFPTRQELAPVAKGTFVFLRRFIETELGFALDEVLEYYHAEVLREQPLDLCERAKLFSIAANRHAHDDPRLAEELAARAVDSAIRALALGCGVVERGKTFAELIEALYAAAYDGDEDCAPYYPLGEDYHLIKPDFLKHPPITSDADPTEAFVTLARQTVVLLLNQVRRPKWEAAIREKWPDILSALAKESPDTYSVALQLPLDSISVGVDAIYIRPYSLSASRVRALRADMMEDAIRDIIPHLPKDLRVRISYVIAVESYGGSNDLCDE